jgi:transposase
VDAIVRWRGRYRQEGLDGLKDRPRSGRPPLSSPGRAI